MKIVAIFAVLALLGYIVFNNRFILSQKDVTEPTIKKIFFILIIGIPLLLAFLYHQKMQNSSFNQDDYLIKSSKKEIGL